MPDPITDKDELLPPLSFRRGLVFGTGFSLLLKHHNCEKYVGVF